MALIQQIAARLGRDPAAYLARRRSAIAAALDDPATMDAFARGGPLPRGHGRRLDERLVEYPWVVAQGLRGRVLDAGSALNHDVVLDRVLPRLDALDVFTQMPEPYASEDPRVSYRYGDLRELDMADGCYDAVCCVSTLEHVGMDNSGYGTEDPRTEDPRHEARRAVDELLRVLRPGGSLLLTVPYGVASDHAWFRQLGRREVEELASAGGAGRADVAVFAYTRSGWRRSDLDGAAQARYRDPSAESLLRRDGAVAARAVACLRLRAPV